MLNKTAVVLVGIAIVVSLALLFFPKVKNLGKPVPTVKEPESDVVITYPKPYQVVTSPLVVKGKAKGTWFFEGELPITLYYGVGSDFVSTYVMAEGEWMTADYVDFELSIDFPVPETNDGLLVIQKNNPSDMRELDDSFEVPLRFH